MAAVRNSLVYRLLTAMAVCGWLAIGVPRAGAQSLVSTGFTYQGRLADAGVAASGLHDFAFRLFDAASGGTPVGPTLCVNDVPVVAGLFTVQLDFGGQYLGAARWLEIAVRADAGGSMVCTSGVFVVLAGRQALAATPYALALPGLWTQNNVLSPNLIGGQSGNSVAAGVSGAVIGGGGWSGGVNRVNANWGVVSGGHSNTVTSLGAAIGGGYNNLASSERATIGGGSDNNAGGAFSTISGGYDNTAGALGSTVIGGALNNATDYYATVAGGYANFAGGGFSFAAGYRAKVRTAAQSGAPNGDQGTFVWADYREVDFTSTGPNQFLIRAAGGVGIGTNSPTRQLEVASDGDTEIGIRSNSANGKLWTLQSSTGIASGQLASSFQIVDRTVGVSRVLIDANGRVGIGTTTPDQTLTVSGNASKPGGGSWAVYSDPRLKHDIRPMSGTLDALLSLHGYSFEYNAEAVASGKGLPGRQLGLMADEVERVFPEWVSRNDEGYRAVTERATTALMVEALRDMRAEKDAQMEALQRRNAAMEAELKELRALTEALMQRVGGAQK